MTLLPGGCQWRAMCYEASGVSVALAALRPSGGSSPCLFLRPARRQKYPPLESRISPAPTMSIKPAPVTAALTVRMLPAPVVKCPRLLKPEEIAGALLYLVSPAAGFVTGESIAVDGGLLCRV